jgi:3-methyl-2-oxobutanoate hydroxymethyltransferase
MPFMSYNLDITQALRNAARFIQEGGAQAVKLEGGERMAKTVHHLVENGIPVMGHIGLTPQSVHQLGGYNVQGRTEDAALKLLKDAQALEEAGAFSIVLELVPAPLSRLITERLNIPTIGIGSGPDCDGQVQVISDILGMFPDFLPKHAKLYANIAQQMKEACSTYMEEVKSGAFPTDKESCAMNEEVLDTIASKASCASHPWNS